MIIVNSIPIPLRLTLARLIGGLFILPLLIYFFLPYNNFVLNCVIAGIFFGLALTDLFDGYLARRNNQVSSFGAFLDPIADKFLIISTALTLLSIEKISALFVAIVIIRELFVMSLRQLALEYYKKLSVSFIGKFKMMMQSLYLCFLIMTPYYDAWYEEAPLFKHIQYVLLICTAAVTVISALLYVKRFLSIISIDALCNWDHDADNY